MFFFLTFPGTVITKEEDQVGPQAPEVPHDTSTDSCLTFPYSSNSPRPFPPSPVHSVTDSPIRVSPLFIATSNNSPVHRSIDHYSPVPAASTSPISTSSQTFTPIPSSQITDPVNNPFYTPYFSSSFPQTGPIVFPESPPEFPYLGVPPSGSSFTLSKTDSLPSYPMPSMITSTAKPIPFFSTGPQSTSSSGPHRKHGRNSRGTYSGRGRAPRGRRGIITSTTSPIPSYFWPDYQPSSVSSRDSSATGALNLALMPWVFDHFPTSLPLNPLHYDFFTVLRAASPVVTFHCPSPLTQKSFSSVYSINFSHGHDSKPLLVAGIKQ